ncbi:BON domain-containing protein [Streptomyces sp. NPDC057456]|uniref:BON domain-containing protein n=1 Tax=Streptomyces sp. NPDC057456 TaxID=3346139 RepID=UPI003693B039
MAQESPSGVRTVDAVHADDQGESAAAAGFEACQGVLHDRGAHITRRDLLQVFLRTDDEIRLDVQQEVFVNTLWLAPHTVEAAVLDGVVTLTGQLERRSEIPVAVGMTRRLDGVVDVIDHLSYRIDDKRLQPAEPGMRGVADDWLRKL